MKPFFEFKYLQVNWYDSDTITNIIESVAALDIEYDQVSGAFSTETTIYPKIEGIHRGILAVRFFNEDISQPYINMPNGSKKYLHAIVAPKSGVTWWIVKDKWDSKSNQWFGIAPNIVGKINFVLQGVICKVVINASDFSLVSLEEYLRTFKDDLWELILDENSDAQLAAKSEEFNIINERILECIGNLIHHSQKILEKPKVELRETQSLKPMKSVKPVNRTFMELAIKTNQRLLTSRSTYPSYNVAENRYILFILQRCLCILKQLSMVSNNKSRRYQKTIQNLESQYKGFNDSIKIDRDMIVKDLEKLKKEKDLSYWREKFEQKVKEYNIDFRSNSKDREIFFKIGQKTNYKNSFFVGYWNGKNWIYDSYILDLSYSENLFQILEQGMTIRLQCYAIFDNKQNIKIFRLKSIQEIELWDIDKRKKAGKAFDKEREEGIKLSQNNWLKPLTEKEKEEQNREKVAIKNRIQFYQKNQQAYHYFYQKVKPKLHFLKKIVHRLKALNIQPSSYFPNSMTFVQNPHYQSVHNNYKILREETNLQDDFLLDNLEEIEDIGIINMPILYERLILIQVVSILKNNFRFTPQKDWKYKILQAMRSNEKNIEIYLENHFAKRYIILTYEKELPNGKRPDFTIDLTWFAESDVDKKNSITKRFILDAKFYDKSTFQDKGGMLATIDSLYEGKNYSENGKNPVFLIHPCDKLISSQERISAQSWGEYSFLGELGIRPAHHKGAVFFNPIDRVIYRDELQRLLGMFLQYLLEPSDIQFQKDDRTLAVPICIRCGSSEYQIINKTKYTDKAGYTVERTSKSVWLKCCECEQWQVYNHCFYDKKRLIKNGFYWSYHAARMIEPFNIKCPHCGEWGIWQK